MSFDALFGTTAGFSKQALNRDKARDQFPTLTILYHPDLSRIGERATLTPLLNGREVALSREQPVFNQPGDSETRPLNDPYISRQPLMMLPAPNDGVHLSVADSRTALRVDGRPVNEMTTITTEGLEAGVVLELSERVVLLLHLHKEQDGGEEGMGLIGESSGMVRVRAEIERIADLNVPVLIRGETGTGKELVARAVHNHGNRARSPFVGVNMGAVQTSLAGSELFGNVKGAYTGALQERKGYFRAAHNGSLFLDEVGEAPVDIQVMLLRVLETHEVIPVGGQQAIPVDVRLIAATDANLEDQVNEGSFRGPLLHRLSTYEIWLPALRQRRDDIGRLFRFFLHREMNDMGEAHRLHLKNPLDQPFIPADVVARMALFQWPGNVRQLQNVVRQLVIDNRGATEFHLSEKIQRTLSGEQNPRTVLPARALDPTPHTARKQEPVAASNRPAPRKRRKPADVSEAELVDALSENRWEIQATAETLGISRPSLYLLIENTDKARLAGDVSPEEIQASFDRTGGDLDAMVGDLEISKNALKRRIKELGLKG